MGVNAQAAVVIGAGHNGLVAANLLADRGWNVTVVERSDHVGGAVHSDRSLHPDFVTDWFSAFYPLAAMSPALRSLRLDEYGLSWRHAPVPLAHLFPDDRVAVLSRDVARTADSMEAFAEGDGAAWARVVDEYRRIAAPFLDALLTPFPPIRSGVRLARALGTGNSLRFARFAVQSARRFAEERFSGDGARALVWGNVLHTDLAPGDAGSAVFGWLLAMLGQTVGFPVPQGGSGALAYALVQRLQARGGQLMTGAEVTGIEVQDGRAVGIRLGSELMRADAVLADVSAPHLYDELLDRRSIPATLVRDLRAFEWDRPTLKVNWALSGRIPWKETEVADAGTVHLGVDLHGMTRYAADLATRTLPREPFVLLGQMTTADPTRSPDGTESVWAYTHLPAGAELTDDVVAEQADRIDALIERHAPGFERTVLARSVQSPEQLHSSDGNLLHGAVGGGTSALHQQLVFRPSVGLGRADTVIDGLFLASASAHPGGGVHGAAGANAARAALRRFGRAGGAYRRTVDLAHRRLYR